LLVFVRYHESNSNMLTNETGNKPRFPGSVVRHPSIQLSSSVSSLITKMISPSSKVNSSSLSASQSYRARHLRPTTKLLGCLGGGTGFLILRKSAPEADRLCRCDLEEWLWPGTPFPDSSDKESRLSVDWPLTIRLGPMRFSGEDSSAKLCRGGEVSELPPDFGPTVNKPIGLFP